MFYCLSLLCNWFVVLFSMKVCAHLANCPCQWRWRHRHRLEHFCSQLQSSWCCWKPEVNAARQGATPSDTLVQRFPGNNWGNSFQKCRKVVFSQWSDIRGKSKPQDIYQIWNYIQHSDSNYFPFLGICWTFYCVLWCLLSRHLTPPWRS